MLQTLFEKSGGDTLRHALHHYLLPGDVSGLEGEQIHPMSNVDNARSVLLNFYSPPFRV